MAKRYIPRWLYTEATKLGQQVGSKDSWIKLPAGMFRNDTIWPMQLEHLVVAGLPIVDNAAAAGLVEGQAGIGDLLFAEIGVSQEGPVNLVPAMLNGTFSCTEPARLSCMTQHESVTCHLRHPYRLSRDNGFVVRRRNRVDLLRDDWGTIPKQWLGIIFRGVDIVTGKPVMLGGTNDNRLSTAVDEITFDSADLMNRGGHDVDIYSFSMDSWEYPLVGTGVLESYMVNPILGERWMPGESEVPSGCLAPYAAMGLLNQANWVTPGQANPLTQLDYGPHTFVFPPSTYLHRRQEIGLRLSNSWYALNQPVHVALFGYLEVE